jgi:competence protein ComEA
MSGQSKINPDEYPKWLLRRADQATVAALVLIGLGAMIGWWLAQGGLSGRLIEIDRARPLRASFQVDINRADWPELAQLPGVGETLARRIVDSRRADGPFRDHDDLQRVYGIGPRKLEEIRPFLRPVPPQAAVADGRSRRESPEL